MGHSTAGEMREFILCPKDIKSKVNLIARVLIEHAYYNVTVQHFRHVATGTPPSFNGLFYIQNLHIRFFCSNLMSFGFKRGSLCLSVCLSLSLYIYIYLYISYFIFTYFSRFYSSLSQSLTTLSLSLSPFPIFQFY